MTTLSNIQHNNYVTIDYVNDPALQDLGFLPNTQIRIIARAPFNGPVAVRIDSSVFALRLEETKLINIKIL